METILSLLLGFVGLGLGVLILMLPQLFVAALLAFDARRRWHKTVEQLLESMDFEKVRKRVEWAPRHARILRGHVSLWAVALVLAMLLGPTLLALLFLWTFVISAHSLGYLLYRIRWNPETLKRKQKLDAQQTAIAGDFSLDPNAQYRIGDDGELELLQEHEMDEAQLRLQSW